MSFIVIAICLLLLAWRWGDWREWRKYHATLLYIALMNFTYYFYTNHTELWEFHSSFGHTVNETIYNFIINPLMVFLFLSTYPTRSKCRQSMQIIGFVFAFSLLELMQYKLLGSISYQGGWNYWWSVLLYVVLFPTLRLHYIHPLWAYVLSIGWIVGFLKVFGFL